MIPSIIGLAKLAKMSFDGADLAPVWDELTRTLSNDHAADGSKYAALLDMCVIDQMRGSPERGLQFQALALEECRLYQIPAKTQPPRLTVLGFVVAGKINANTPIEFLIENTDITLLLLYVVPGKPLPPVPAHDAAIVLIADSEAAEPALHEIERLTENWPCPVLNRPGKIPEAGRERLYHLLTPLPGVSIPATVRVSRELLESRPFPVIVRPVDSHAGDGLEKLACGCDASAYLSQRPEAEFFVSPFQDYRSADGYYRKYRIIIVDGKPFPCHMAISDHWMIHYLNAGMEENTEEGAEKRREEARFFDEFHADFGLRHRRVLAEIAEVLGLDYFGIDCAETPDGRLLIFEAGTALVVHDMDAPDIFPYKHRHMQALFSAFQALLCRQ